MFQPTRPRGARPFLVAVSHAPLAVSTHAPTRGATPALLISSMMSLFQPTRPRGARPFASSIKRRYTRFNPRAHEGRDISLDSMSGLRGVSTHAPTRGATTFLLVGESLECFNPRAHEGRDCPLIRLPSPAARFNPRAHEGRDAA